MSSNLCMDELAAQILSELRSAPTRSQVGENVLDAVVDAMVQANIDLDTVSLRDVKTLLAHVCRTGRDRPPFRLSATAC